MDFVVRRDTRPSATVLAVRGELDIATVKVLRAEVEQVLTETPPTMYLDLSDAEFIDSTGCRELVRSAKCGRAAGVAVELVVPTENWRIRRVIDFMQFGDLLPVHEDLPAA